MAVVAACSACVLRGNVTEPNSSSSGHAYSRAPLNMTLGLQRCSKTPTFYGEVEKAVAAVTEAAQQASYKLAEVVYQAAEAADAEAGAGAEGGASSDDVVDADYEVVDDEEK